MTAMPVSAASWVPDAANARHLQDHCDVHEIRSDTLVMRDEVRAFGSLLAIQLGSASDDHANGVDPRPALITKAHRYHPQMVGWVVEQIDLLVNGQGLPTNEMSCWLPFSPMYCVLD